MSKKISNIDIEQLTFGGKVQISKHGAHNKNHPPTRIDPDFTKWTKKIAGKRFKNDLEEDLIPPHEVTRMIMNTESLLGMEKELTTKPRRRK